MGHSIKTVAEITGVPRNTLLAWERRYGLVRPGRKANGYREYSDEDVSLLLSMKRLVDQGLRPSEAVEQLSADAPARDAVSDEREALLGALTRFDRSGAEKIAARVTARSYAQLLDELYLPLLRKLGQGWAEGRYSVTQEHFATEFVRARLLAMLLHLDFGPIGGPLTVLGCYPGERHELGLMALGVRLAMRGDRVDYLGADVPLDDLLDTVEELEPAVVGISAIRPVDRSELADFATRLRQVAPEGTRVIIGGSGLPVDPPAVAGVEWFRSIEEYLGRR